MKIWVLMEYSGPRGDRFNPGGVYTDPKVAAEHTTIKTRERYIEEFELDAMPFS